MEISDDEINAANYELSRHVEGRGVIDSVRAALEAAYAIRKARKQAKRQRKGKDRQERAAAAVISKVMMPKWEGVAATFPKDWLDTAVYPEGDPKSDVKISLVDRGDGKTQIKASLGGAGYVTFNGLLSRDEAERMKSGGWSVNEVREHLGIDKASLAIAPMEDDEFTGAAG